MGSWATVTFECESSAGRRRLLRLLERTHPVDVPVGRYSTTGTVETAGGTADADLAWTGRYLHLTTPGDPRPLVGDTVERWERAAVVEVDRASETVREGRFVDTTGPVSGGRLRGADGWGGLGLLYALAMTHDFRFRPCASRSPPGTDVPLPNAFTDPAALVTDLDRFCRRLQAVTGVEPTADGRELLRSDPAGRDRFVYDGPGGSQALALRETPPAADARDRRLVETDGGEPVDEGNEGNADGALSGLAASLLGGDG